MWENAKMIGMYIISFTVPIVIVWYMASAFADKMAKHEVITPTIGVSCIVVSRMFNTSVDCWKDDVTEER